MANGNVCQHNQFGFCKYGETCKYRHINEKCENENCEMDKCLKRHPGECKYYRTHGRCKFLEYCAYEHILQDKPNTDLANALEIVKVDLADMQKVLEDEANKIKNLIEVIANQTQEIASLKSNLDEKEIKIKTLEVLVEKIPNVNCREPYGETLIIPSPARQHLKREVLEATNESVRATIAPLATRLDDLEQETYFRCGDVERKIASLLELPRNKRNRT